VNCGTGVKLHLSHIWLIVSQTPEAKLQQISELAQKSKSGVITLDDSTYAYYATSKPRPYSLIVLLTATHPKFRCSVCKDLDSELALLAQSYAKSANKDSSNRVFFVRLDYESSAKVFQSYQVNSVPLLFYLGQQHAGEKPGSEYQISPRDKYQVPPSPDAESLAGFLQDRASVSVKIERSKLWSYIILLVLFAIVLALVQPVINSLPFWLRMVQWKPIWIVVSCGVYTCAISGMIYDIIRSPQM
jgi:oligosaccharyltransferase complex subunit gamma